MPIENGIFQYIQVLFVFFYFIYTERSWIAQVEGKKYYLLNLNEEEQASESIARENQDGKPKDSTNPEIASSPRHGNKSHRPKQARGGFSLLGDILASPTYVIASLALIVSFGLAVGFQASELKTLKQVEDPLRGGKEIFQIVENPLEAAQSFLNELISEDITYQMEFESKDKIIYGASAPFGFIK
jgi:hypothetical protein